MTEYNLVSNLDKDGIGKWTVKRCTESHETPRYDMRPSVGNFADFDGFYDVIIGKLIDVRSYAERDNVIEREFSDDHTIENIIEMELSELEVILNDVRTDIPDAKIIVGSYLN